MPFTHTLRGLGPIQQPTSHHSSSRAMLSRYRWYIDQLYLGIDFGRPF